jgi:hypothetical protein
VALYFLVVDEYAGGADGYDGDGADMMVVL